MLKQKRTFSRFGFTEEEELGNDVSPLTSTRFLLRKGQKGKSSPLGVVLSLKQSVDVRLSARQRQIWHEPRLSCGGWKRCGGRYEVFMSLLGRWSKQDLAKYSSYPLSSYARTHTDTLQLVRFRRCWGPRRPAGLYLRTQREDVQSVYHHHHHLRASRHSPSSSSRLAPPPVLTWLTLSSVFHLAQQVAVSPPPGRDVYNNKPQSSENTNWNIHDVLSFLCQTFKILNFTEQNSNI